jgi:hypothetical protein
MAESENELEKKLTDQLRGSLMALQATEHEGSDFNAYARGVLQATFEELSQAYQLNDQQKDICKSIAQMLAYADRTVESQGSIRYIDGGYVGDEYDAEDDLDPMKDKARSVEQRLLESGYPEGDCKLKKGKRDEKPPEYLIF